nr:poly (ADP ribose) polymerase 1 [Hymenolepis microstoma]
MEPDYKYQAEYAKSNRSSCRACKNTIGMGSLRMGALVQSYIFDGKMTLWYHYSCFFKKTKVLQTSDIKNFDNLKFEDQEKIRAEISSEKFLISNYIIKANSDDLSKCTNCSKIIKDPFFIDGKLSELGTSYHVKCFVKKYSEADVSKIRGFGKLKAQEKFDLLDALSKIKTKSAMKRKTEESDNENQVPPSKKSRAPKAPVEFTKDALKAQSDELWRLRDRLDEEVSTQALAGLLEYNNQAVPSGRSDLLDAVADAMIFGALPACPDDGAPLRLADGGGGYRCSRLHDNWAPCLFSAPDSISIKRRIFRVPKEYYDVSFLKSYKCKPRERLFAAATDAAIAVSTKDRFDAKKPLVGLHFLFDNGPFTAKLSQRDLAAKVRSLGGSILTNAARGGVFITTGGTEGVEGKLATKARSVGMRPLSCSRLLNKTLTKKFTSADDVQKFLNEDPLVSVWESSSTNSATVEPTSSTSLINLEEGRVLQKMLVKGGAVVDPDSGLDHCASVATDSNGRLLTAVLGLVDLVRGSNSYYKLQVLRSDDEPRKYWVFRSWGRIGTDIGGSKVERFTTLDAAAQNFQELFLEKTGNAWGTPKGKFLKLPRRFYPLDMEHFNPTDEETAKVTQITKIPSKLETRVQALINFLFDVASMTNALIEFEIDLRKMPLGKISRAQIQEAYSVLSDISTLLSSNKALEGPAKSKLIGDTTRFYTLIPHDFGMKMPPLLDNLEVIKSKSKMLEDLLKIEVAYSLMKTSNSDVNPIDEHYEKLKNRIEPMDRESEEFIRIAEYLRATHAPTHSTYTLDIVDIFSLSREGEASKFKALENRMLLWHGSRRTNFAGILAQGLRIAPPEAPSTGYMFGKGVYFSDMSSKSANYCYTSPTSARGCLLLCDVALGKEEECFSAKDSQLAKKFNSRKGVGATAPNPQTYYKDPETGVVYPIGEPVTSADIKSDLLYNEYIVYDTAQIQQRYLVWVDFKYKF